MTKQQLIKLTEEIENFVADKIDMDTFDKDFNRVVRELYNRHRQPELDLIIK